MSSSAYIDVITDILAQDLKRDDLLAKLVELCDEIVDNTRSDANEFYDSELQNDLDFVEREWREIVDSFKKKDLADVRTRLMDLGTRAFKVDVWIPSQSGKSS